MTHTHFFDFLEEHSIAVSQVIRFLEDKMDVTDVMITNITHDMIKQSMVLHFEQNGANFGISIDNNLFYERPNTIYQTCKQIEGEFDVMQHQLHKAVLDNHVSGTIQ